MLSKDIVDSFSGLSIGSPGESHPGHSQSAPPAVPPNGAFTTPTQHAHHHTHINSDLHARVLAFQQQRTNKPSPGVEDDDILDKSHNLPPLPAQNIRSLSSGDAKDDIIRRTDAKPAPFMSAQFTSTPFTSGPFPLSTPESSDSASALGTPRGTPGAGTPRAGTPRDGTPTVGSPSLSGAAASSPGLAFSAPIDSNPKKTSLAQRRNGMKLNINDINPTRSAALSPDADVNRPVGGEISRRLSERRKKPNFKLNLNSESEADSSSTVPTPAQDAKSVKPKGMLDEYSNYIDVKSGALNFTGKASLHSQGIDFSSGTSFRISLDQLQFIEELGRGNYGTVSKVLHKPTGVLMAMKEVRLELDEQKFTQILMELEILHKCHSDYIVEFYGAFFVEGAVYMCIECMEGGSLDQVYEKDIGIRNESYLAYITESVIRGLKELKDEHNIIHRDVKPTNILVSATGKVKLCDFGVSGNLVASLAKTNIGCQSYMAPERIKSLNPDDSTYSVQSDIWSLGLTILEIAKGNYPYPADTYDNIFSQLSAMVDGEPPKLDPKRYSKNAQLFVKSCLNKNPNLRPSYSTLLAHPWLTEYKAEFNEKDFEAFVMGRIASRRSEKKGGRPRENVSSLLKGKVRAPALHRGGLNSNNNIFLGRR